MNLSAEEPSLDCGIIKDFASETIESVLAAKASGVKPALTPDQKSFGSGLISTC